MKSEHMIPTIYRRSFDIRTMCRYFDLELDLLQYYTNHILDCYSPEHCPVNLLAELAEHIGFDYNELKSVMYNRVVLKNFIQHLIRYRGSQTGISNAAAIDLRYRQTYQPKKLNPETGEWEDDADAGKQIPMEYNEAIPVERTWIDVDNVLGIIYLFIISDSFLPEMPADATEEDKAKIREERMRRLLDLAYLQEYVRPVGMYLLPLVAKKVDAKTDLSVKAIRIPKDERRSNNGVLGTPNASMEHAYDRMHFAKLENPNDDVNTEPWLRTLYHSQVAGNLNNQYFNKPVYHITGKFLYYDHQELMDVFSNNTSVVGGMKVGDSLFNPNKVYGPDSANDPKSLEEDRLGYTTTEPLQYNDTSGWNTKTRYVQATNGDEPVVGGDFPPYLHTLSEGKNFMINLYEDDEVKDFSIEGKQNVNKNTPYDQPNDNTMDGSNAALTFEKNEDNTLIP